MTMDAPDPWRNEDDTGGRRAGAREWLWIAGVVAGLIALFFFLWSRFPGALDGQWEISRFVYLLLLIAAVGAGVIWRSAFRMGEALRHAAIWIGIAFVLVAGYGFRDELSLVKDRVVGELLPQRAVVRGGEIAITRSRNGHFLLDAEVDGQTVRFMVDTGASSVTLGMDDARRLGFRTNDLAFNAPTQTANGTAYGAPVRLDEIRVGTITMYDVPAMVNGGEMAGSLLGLSFLDRLRSYEVRGDRLILRP